jgi:hypothetical protein
MIACSFWRTALIEVTKVMLSSTPSLARTSPCIVQPASSRIRFASSTLNSQEVLGDSIDGMPVRILAVGGSNSGPA